jgi:hypothetical protein
MGENTISNNLFAEAVGSKELDKFLLGQGKYFVQDKEFGEHWPYGSFKNHIEPYIKEHGEDKFQREFWSGVFQVISTSTDPNIGLDTIVNYLTPFYNAADPKVQAYRVKNTPQTFISTFQQLMKANKRQLVLDKRSVGAEWCSATNNGLGLWGGIIYNLKIIRKRSGLDLVPQDES